MSFASSYTFPARATVPEIASMMRPGRSVTEYTSRLIPTSAAIILTALPVITRLTDIFRLSEGDTSGIPSVLIRASYILLSTQIIDYRSVFTERSDIPLRSVFIN